MVALVDANNFYVSCETSFNPGLAGKPVVVLSNRDGCIVARSNAAKALGIKMGAPLFEIEALRQQHEIVLFSSNYTLYGDLSARLMSILNQFVEDLEVYSIDEAFLSVAGYEAFYKGYQALGNTIRQTALQWLRIPVSVGFAPTKTLAKVANYYAKRRPELNGVCILESPQDIQEALDTLPVEEIWGIGNRYARKLHREGIHTAAQLRTVNDSWINQVMTVNGLRIVHELRGTPCQLLENVPQPRKSMGSAPSFGQVCTDLETLADALTHHLSRLGEKLRRQNSLCGSLTVFIHTSRFRKTPANGLPVKPYYASRTVRLPHPTSDTLELNRYAQQLLTSIYATGYHYQKVGILLTELMSAAYRQKGIFVEGPNEQAIQLASLVDAINQRYGRDTIRLASQHQHPQWTMIQRYRSPRYTTRWDEILCVS